MNRANLLCEWDSCPYAFGLKAGIGEEAADGAAVFGKLGKPLELFRRLIGLNFNIQGRTNEMHNTIAVAFNAID